MKIRTDFVTNSSSSSFIMAFKREDATQNKYARLLNATIDFVAESADYGDTEEAIICVDMHDFTDYLREHYVWCYSSLEEALAKDTRLKDIYDEGKSFLDRGYYVMFKEVGYHNDSLQGIIQCLSECDENFIIISDDEA